MFHSHEPRLSIYGEEFLVSRLRKGSFSYEDSMKNSEERKIISLVREELIEFRDILDLKVIDSAFTQRILPELILEDFKKNNQGRLPTKERLQRIICDFFVANEHLAWGTFYMDL